MIYEFSLTALADTESAQDKILKTYLSEVLSFYVNKYEYEWRQILEILYLNFMFTGIPQTIYLL